MKSSNAAVEIARIEARKTILSGVIGGLVTLATVLAGHWYSNRGPAQPPGSTADHQAPGTVLDAPKLNWESKHIDWPLATCMEKATASLEGSGLTGQVVGDYAAWGYQNETVGVIWCNTDSDLAIFVAAGEDGQATARMVKLLIGNF